MWPWYSWVALYVSGYVVSYVPVLKYYIKSDKFKSTQTRPDRYGYEEKTGVTYRSKSNQQDMTAATVATTLAWPFLVIGSVGYLPALGLFKLTQRFDDHVVREEVQP